MAGEVAVNVYDAEISLWMILVTKLSILLPKLRTSDHVRALKPFKFKLSNSVRSQVRSPHKSSWLERHAGRCKQNCASDDGQRLTSAWKAHERVAGGGAQSLRCTGTCGLENDVPRLWSLIACGIVQPRRDLDLAILAGSGNIPKGSQVEFRTWNRNSTESGSLSSHTQCTHEITGEAAKTHFFPGFA